MTITNETPEPFEGTAGNSGSLVYTSNPFEYVGQLHNIICEHFSDKFQLIDTTYEAYYEAIDVSRAMEHLEEFDYNFYIENKTIFQDIWNNSTEQNYDTLIVDLNQFTDMSTFDKQNISRIINALDFCGNYSVNEDIQLSMIRDSLSVIENDIINYCDSNNIYSFIAISVAKNSSELWYQYNNELRNMKKNKICDLKKCAAAYVAGHDVHGAVKNGYYAYKVFKWFGPKIMATAVVVSAVAGGAISSVKATSHTGPILLFFD